MDIKLLKTSNHWIPQQMHGTVPYVEGQDIEQLVRSKIKQLVPSKFIRDFETIKYRVDGNTLTFEIL